MGSLTEHMKQITLRYKYLTAKMRHYTSIIQEWVYQWKYLKLWLEQLIEASSTRNEIKTSLRFNKKNNTNKSSYQEIESYNKPNLRLIPSNLKTLLSFPDKFCKCHKIRLTVNRIIFNHFEY